MLNRRGTRLKNAPAAYTTFLAGCSSNLEGYVGKALKLTCLRDPQGQDEAGVGAGEGVAERAALPTATRAAVVAAAGGGVATWAHLGAGTHQDLIFYFSGCRSTDSAMPQCKLKPSAPALSPAWVCAINCCDQLRWTLHGLLHTQAYLHAGLVLKVASRSIN